MINLDTIIKATQQNCHISDARHAGNYTMCIFLLKMREYYRWEQKIPYAEQLPRKELGNWLTEREALWDEVEHQDYHQLQLSDAPDTYDAFDSDNINLQLAPQQLIYSSGLGVFSKPHFFVGKLLRSEKIDNNILYVAGEEYARDLVAPPAMSQCTDKRSTIYIRQESVHRFMWERIEQWQWNGKKERAMSHAVDCYGGSDNLDSLLDTMTENEINTMILHEVGESQTGRQLGSEGQQSWQQMVQQSSASRTEFLLRAARDIAADCSVTLPALLSDENDAALHFYFANYSGMRKHLFPEMLDAYHDWLENRSQTQLTELIKQGDEHWHNRLRQTISAWQKQQDIDHIASILEAA